jgi:hypothetical protein
MDPVPLKNKKGQNLRKLFKMSPQQERRLYYDPYLTTDFEKRVNLIEQQQLPLLKQKYKLKPKVDIKPLPTEGIKSILQSEAKFGEDVIRRINSLIQSGDYYPTDTEKKRFLERIKELNMNVDPYEKMLAKYEPPMFPYRQKTNKDPVPILTRQGYGENPQKDYQILINDFITPLRRTMLTELNKAKITPEQKNMLEGRYINPLTTLIENRKDMLNTGFFTDWTFSDHQAKRNQMLDWLTEFETNPIPYKDVYRYVDAQRKFNQLQAEKQQAIIPEATEETSNIVYNETTDQYENIFANETPIETSLLNTIGFAASGLLIPALGATVIGALINKYLDENE